MLPRISLISFGKPSSLWDPVLKDYEQRISKLSRFEHIVLKETGHTVEQTKTQASLAVQKRIPSGATVLILDENGARLTSVELANQMKELADKHVVFVVGSSYGLDLGLLTKYKTIKLSDMVLPHDLARVLLLEQLFRANAININHPYHHG